MNDKKLKRLLDRLGMPLNQYFASIGGKWVIKSSNQRKRLVSDILHQQDRLFSLKTQKYGRLSLLFAVTSAIAAVVSAVCMVLTLRGQ